MIEPPDKPLQDATEETLSREASASNKLEIKEEPVDPNVHEAAELLEVMQNPSADLPDATRNLIVALPSDMQLSLDSESTTKHAIQEAATRPCSVKLSRCDIVVSRPPPPNPHRSKCGGKSCILWPEDKGISQKEQGHLHN